LSPLSLTAKSIGMSPVITVKEMPVMTTMRRMEALMRKKRARRRTRRKSPQRMAPQVGLDPSMKAVVF